MTRSGSPFEPLRHPAYRRLWFGALCLNLGLWMQVVTAAWLMVSLQGTPLQVGLIQTASALPAFLFALPGGVIADLVERRRYLLRAQSASAVVALLTAALAATDSIGAASLLGLTFGFGLAYAVQGPAWFTAQLDVLPQGSRLAAVSLGAVSYSSARAIGPALAGGLMVWSSPALVFFVVGGIALVSVLLLHGVSAIPRQHAPDQARESFRAAFAGALHFARTSQPLQAQLLRTVAFVLPAAALWALLPLLLAGDSSGGAGHYGLLLGSLGVGAVAGALLLPGAAARGSRRRIDTIGVAAFLCATLAAALIADALVLLVLLFFAGGIGWSWVSNLGVANLQTQAAPHLRARALGLYLIAFQGSLALGGALWGQFAKSAGVREALFVAAAGLVAAGWLSRRLPWPGAPESPPLPR